MKGSFLFLKILWVTLLGLWLIFVLLGKRGFIHILLLNGISILAIELVAKFRARGVARNTNGPAN